MMRWETRSGSIDLIPLARGGGAAAPREEAVDRLCSALRKEPSNPVLHRDLGRLQQATGRFEVLRGYRRTDQEENSGQAKKVLVVSHERSGTHFLINALAYNFGWLAYPIDLDLNQGVDWNDPREITAWLERFRDRPVANIFKSHHERAFLEPVLPLLREQFHVFYIYRDGRDVMTSFWRYLHTLGWDEGPRMDSVGAFMRTCPKGRLTRYQKTRGSTMLERWVRHLEGWCSSTESGVTVVSYEALSQQFDATVQGFSRQLGAPRHPLVRPGLGDISISPWKGALENWRSYFSEEDLDYYRGEVARLLRRRPGAMTCLPEF